MITFKGFTNVVLFVIPWALLIGIYGNFIDDGPATTYDVIAGTALILFGIRLCMNAAVDEFEKIGEKVDKVQR